MSNQSRKVRDKLIAAKPELILPEARDPRQRWLVIRRDPQDNKPGCFFVTHGRNQIKFGSMPGHEIMLETFDKAEATYYAHRATIVCGPAYQPKNSAHAGEPFKAPEKPDIFGPNPDMADPGGTGDASPQGQIITDPSKLN